jgi:hypothetical protein
MGTPVNSESIENRDLVVWYGAHVTNDAALDGAVIVRMRWHAPTIAYVQRRTAEGLTKKEIVRCGLMTPGGACPSRLRRRSHARSCGG